MDNIDIEIAHFHGYAPSLCHRSYKVGVAVVIATLKLMPGNVFRKSMHVFQNINIMTEKATDGFLRMKFFILHVCNYCKSLGCLHKTHY